MATCDNPINSTNRGTLTFELTTTALCDLNCTYCFEGVKSNPKKLQDLDILIKRINEMLEFDWFKENYTDISISFWGGEPTLNYNYIIKIITAFKDDDRVKFHMYSNGYNIENMKKVLENVDYSKFEIQISYDGRLINDLFRVTHTQKSSVDNVLKTFRYIAEKGIKVFFKSTVPNGSISYLHETWKNFYELHKEYKEFENVRISFAPTIDYTMIHSEEEKKEKVKIFREQILKIAKDELQFFKENNRFLMTWFGSKNEKINCSAGLNMVSIDVDGKSYACHGTLYSKDKEQFNSASIFEDDFINKIKIFNDRFEPAVKNVSDVCKNCVATMCMICPVSSFTASKETEFFDKWTDRQINGLCEFYQTFGEIDRSVQSYLRRK